MPIAPRFRRVAALQRPFVNREQVLADFDGAISMVVATIGNQSADDWMAPYSAEREPLAKDRFGALMRCAGHAYHHVGQIIYLSKDLMKPRN